jgi:hypothetical protein
MESPGNISNTQTVSNVSTVPNSSHSRINPMEDQVYTLTPQQLIELLEDTITRYDRHTTRFTRSRVEARELAITQTLKTLLPDRQLKPSSTLMEVLT